VLCVVGDEGTELTEVFVAEGGRVQFNEDVAPEHAVVNHAIHEEVFASNEDALLPGFEAEAVRQPSNACGRAVDRAILRP
jgi:hypothetical protein